MADSAGVSPDGSKLRKEHIMSGNLYVGNLTFSTTSSDLEALFAPHGVVNKAQVIADRDSGSSRGFGFVEMASSEEAAAAISSLNGHNLDGRDLTVNLAKERSR
jgi:RNA recognition motif-containing protein